MPYAGNHSIQEAQVGLQFHHEFNQQEIELARGSVEVELKDVLPRSAEIRGGSVSVTVDLSSQDPQVRPDSVVSNLAGFQLSDVKGDGQPSRVLRLAGNLLSLNILDYTGWATILSDSIKCFETALFQLPFAGNPVMAYTLRYIDRYTFNGDPSEATAALLFVESNEYISKHCFTAGSLWHCHSGWFDSINAGRVLNNLNISSGMMDLSSTVTIDHQTTLHLTLPRQSVGAVFATPERSLGLEAILDVLHDSNKRILNTLLRPEMRAKIGLYL